MSAEVEAKVPDPTTNTESKAEEVKPVADDSTTTAAKDSADATEGAKADNDKNSSEKANGEENDEKKNGDDKPRYNRDRNGYDRRDDRKGGKFGKGNYNNKGGNYNNKGGDRKYSNYNKQKNIKSRYDDDEPTDDPVQIRKQVEFYFSDANLKQDRFLFEQIEGCKNTPVDIKVISSFKRMRRFTPYSAIVAALKESDMLNVIDEEGVGREQVVRKTPLPEDLGTNHREVMANYASESMKRSIYVKGFGEETRNTQVKVEELFQPFGVTSVRLRRIPDGSFKGSAFIEFPSEDEANQFLELDDKPKWTDADGNEKELLIKSKTDYCKEKDELINAGKIRPNDQDDQPRGSGSGRGGFKNRGGRGGGYKGGKYGGGRRRDDSRGRSRSRSRSRSGSRDLRNDDWKELRAKDNKRDGRREKDEKKEEKDEGPKQEFDEVGIPKIMTTEPTTSGSKKRPAEDDGEGTEAKKAKPEE